MILSHLPIHRLRVLGHLFVTVLSFERFLFQLCWVFAAVWAHLWLQRAGTIGGRGVRASCGGGVSCCGAWAPGHLGSAAVACGLSSCVSRALEQRLSSWDWWAPLPCSTGDLPARGLNSSLQHQQAESSPLSP